MGDDANPLLDIGELPRYAQLRAEDVAPALRQLLATARDALRAAADAAPRWSALVDPLELATERLARAWGVVGHLSAVADTPELRVRTACREAQPWWRR